MAIAISDVSGCIVSKKAVLERGVEHNTRPVGSGPYQVVSVEKQRGAVLKRNPGYSGPKPAFEEIRISYIPDPKTAELALRSGNWPSRSCRPPTRSRLAPCRGSR